METMVFGVTLQAWSYLAITISAVVAVVTYLTATRAQARQRSIDNAMRYWECHGKLDAPGGYMQANVKAMEARTYKRNEGDVEMELKFHRFLADCEHVALVQRAGGVPKEINAYMLGWFAQRIFPVLTDREKGEPYWEIAVDFIRETKLEADRLDKMTKDERVAYLKVNHFK